MTSAISSCCYSIPLTVASWNIAEAAPSFCAPDKARRIREAPRLIRECLLSSKQQPDIIALQECPYPSFGSELFAEFGYVSSAGTVMSHCGYVDLLLKQQLAKQSRPITLGSDLSSVATRIILPNKAIISVSSSHLAPFKTGATERLMQCLHLMESLHRESENMVLVGDFNMRAAEDDSIERLGSWRDAWKETGSNRSNKFTWDSFANHFHEDGFSFKARFDRCYVRGGDILSVNNFGLIGNKPVGKSRGGGSAKDYLSDHFGMVVGIDVQSPLES